MAQGGIEGGEWKVGRTGGGGGGGGGEWKGGRAGGMEGGEGEWKVGGEWKGGGGMEGGGAGGLPREGEERGKGREGKSEIPSLYHFHPFGCSVGLPQ